MSRTGRVYSAKLSAYNQAKRAEASGRWKLMREMKKTHTSQEIREIMGLSRQQVNRLLEKGRRFFGDDVYPPEGQGLPKGIVSPGPQDRPEWPS